MTTAQTRSERPAMGVGTILTSPDPDAAAERCRALGIDRLGIHCAGLPGFDAQTFTGTPDKAYLKNLVAQLGERGLEVSCLVKLHALGLDQDIVRNPAAHRREIDGALATIEAAGEAGIDTILHYVNTREPEDPAADEDLWGNLGSIFRELVRQAEVSNVKLANHGLWMTVKEPLRARALASGVTYADYRHFRPPEWPGPFFVRTAGHIARIIEEEAPSPNNGICLCTGMYINGDDVPEMVKRFRGKIHMAQMRDIKSGRWPYAEECMPGEGELDFPEILSLLHEGGYRGMVHPEHFGVPRHSGEDQEAIAGAQVKEWIDALTGAAA